MVKQKILTKLLSTTIAMTMVMAMFSGTTVMAAENNESSVMTVLGKKIFLRSEDVDLEEYDASLATLDIAEVSGKSVKNDISPYAATSLRYAWNYNTYPYDFSTQKWSTNVNIYDTYASTGDIYDSKFTYTLTNPTGPISYQNAIREGYLKSGSDVHIYSHVVSGNYNNVLLMYDDDVIYDIWEKDTFNSVFSSSSNALIGGTTDTETMDGRHKTLDNLQLRSGEYYIIFITTTETETNKNHYALYTGCPLPIKSTAMVSGTHNGTVYWNGGGLNAEREKVCPAVSLSVPSGLDPGLFALNRVYFEDYSLSGAQDLYVSDVTYYYMSPANSSYKILSESGDMLYDNTPSACSVEGTYRTKFNVTWSPTLSYVSAYYSALTMMYVDYMTPYGLYEGM